MTHINGAHDFSITVYAAQAPDWSEQVFSFLSEQGCRLHWQPTPTEDEPATRPAPDAIIILDPTDCERLKSPAATDGRRPLHVLITPNLTRDHHVTELDAILPPQPVVVYKELCIHLRHQAEMTALRDQLQQLQQENADLRANIEEQERLRRHLETLKNAIVTNVSHELKTPLLQVKSAVALMAEDIEDEKLVNFATNATARLEALVKNITLMGSNLAPQLGPVIVPDTIEYARRNLSRAWDNRDAHNRIQIERDAKLPPVLADRQGLSTVLQLLLDNALKFSQGAVIASARRIGDEVEIAVTDSGIGIAADHLNTIFDTFYQVDGSSTRRYGGSGVGLAIVRLILDHHHTQIKVKSHVGEGTTFAFRLPVVHL